MGCRNADIYNLRGLEMVSTVQSEWCDDLVTASVHMLSKALRTANQHPMDKFVLVSDSTLPIKPFAEVYDVLSRGQRSDFCLYTAALWSNGTGELNNSFLVMAHQWFGLTREDAAALVDFWVPPNLSQPHPPGQYFLPFKLPLWGSRLSTREEIVTSDMFPHSYGCPDELAVFASLYGVIPAGWEENYTVPGFGEVDMYAENEQGRCRTLVAWADEPAAQELLFDSCEDDRGTVVRNSTTQEPGVIESLGENTLIKLRKSEFLFVRKVSENASLPNFSQHALSDP